MTAIADRYRRLSGRLTNLINSVPAASWSAPSPCEDWTALDVLDHLVQTECAMLERVALAPGDALDLSDPVATWLIVSGLLQQALDEPGKAKTAYEGYFGPTTFEATIDQFYSFDIAVHTWDIARATGQRAFETIPEDEIARARSAVAGFGEHARVPGILGPEVPVASDADDQTRLLGLLGRAA